MSVESLPEELLEQVLSICLAPPSWSVREYFCDDGIALRARIRDRNPGLLLVSKRWFRISAPLLYSSLVLSSPTHTTSLAPLLRRNSELATVVRSLWLEPPFPKELHHIIKGASNIDHLYIDLNLDVGHHINGLRSVLPLMNPKILCLAGLGRKWHNAVRLEAVIASCIREHWTSLVRLYILLPVLHRLMNCTFEDHSVDKCIEPVARYDASTAARTFTARICCAGV